MAMAKKRRLWHLSLTGVGRNLMTEIRAMRVQLTAWKQRLLSVSTSKSASANRWLLAVNLGRSHSIIALAVGSILLARRAEKELVYVDELERSNQELDYFAYIASHDLKEPLRGLFNHATFLAGRLRGQAR